MYAKWSRSPLHSTGDVFFSSVQLSFGLSQLQLKKNVVSECNQESTGGSLSVENKQK